MRIRIDMGADETAKAKSAAIEVLSRLAPFDEDVAKAFEGLLIDDYIERLPDAVRTLVDIGYDLVDHELPNLETALRTPEE